MQTEPPHGNHHLQLIKSFKSRSEKEWKCEIILSTRTMKDWQETKADRFRFFSPTECHISGFPMCFAGRLLPLAVEQPTRSLNMQDLNPSVGVTQVICSPQKKTQQKKCNVSKANLSFIFHLNWHHCNVLQNKTQQNRCNKETTPWRNQTMEPAYDMSSTGNLSCSTNSDFSLPLACPRPKPTQ